MGRKRVLAGREDELRVKYREGASIAELAAYFRVAASTIGLELDRIGERKQVRIEDVQAGFERMKADRDFSFVLGMIWGLGSFIGNRFVIRHKNREIIDRIYAVLKLAHVSQPYEMSGKYYIQIGKTHPFVEFLASAGWIGRKSAGREMPTVDVDLEGFVCGFVRVHHTLGWSSNRVRKNYLRLRIYGSAPIIDAISGLLSSWTGVGRKNLQAHTQSDKMVTLEYSNREEVERVVAFLGLKIPPPPPHNPK